MNVNRYTIRVRSVNCNAYHELWPIYRFSSSVSTIPPRVPLLTLHLHRYFLLKDNATSASSSIRSTHLSYETTSNTTFNVPIVRARRRKSCLRPRGCARVSHRDTTPTHSETSYTRTERTVAWNDICALDAKCPESFRERAQRCFLAWCADQVARASKRLGHASRANVR